MIIIDKLKIRWNGANRKHFESILDTEGNQKYKFTKANDEFIIDMDDLNKGANWEVEYKCDYCGNKDKKAYHLILKGRKNINKDCCGNDECMQKKREEVFMLKYGSNTPLTDAIVKEKIKNTNLERYGVENYRQTEECSEKIRNTSLERYGVENPTQNEEIKNKVKQTNLERYGTTVPLRNPEVMNKMKQANLEKYGVEYVAQVDAFRDKQKESIKNKYGVDYYFQTEEFKEKFKEISIEKFGTEHPFQSEQVKEKIRQTNLERYGVENVMYNQEFVNKIMTTLHKNGTAPTSRQQLYLYEILGGELNYPVGNCMLDIAFPNEKIYVEYDGSGHELCVKLGTLTQKEFDQKSRRRYYFLKNRGWKEIRIISTNDLLPNELKINEIIKFSKKLLSNERSYVEINLDKKVISTSVKSYDFDFGELKKVKIS